MVLALMCSSPSYAQLLEIVFPADSSVSYLTSQAVIAKGMPGFDVQLFVNGELAKKDQIRIDGVVDLLNIKVPVGDIHYELKLVNPDGSVITSEKRMIHVFGPPASIKVEVDKQRLPADGVSTLSGSVRVFDKWGYQLPEGFVSIGVDSGKILTADVDSTKRGTQLRLVNGVANFEYQSGKNAGRAVIFANSDVIRTDVEIYLDTPIEPFSVVGLVSGSGMMASRKGNTDGLASEKSFPDKFNTDGRIAVYGRGTVADKYLLTLSYDTDRRDRSRLFRDIDPDYLYSIYGDNSLLSYDAQTHRHLFAKIEKNQSYLLFGDYNTDLTNQEFTMYNRSLSGFKANHEDKKWKITGFATMTDRQVVQVEIRGEGLSGLYYLQNVDITPGSEKIRIETRDRYHSHVVIDKADKYRFSDYDIDYRQGTIYFKQPVPAIDKEGNPVYIVATFEAVSQSDKSYIAGGRIEHKPFEFLTVGITGITEEQQPKNYTLLGSDIKLQVNNYFTLSGELGRSENILGSGLAYKVESGISPFSNLSFKGYYRNVENGFFNITQSGGQRELGTVKYGAGGSYRPFSSTKLTTDFYKAKQENISGSSDIKSISGGIEQQIMKGLSTQIKVEDITHTGITQDTIQQKSDTRSTLATSTLSYSVNQKLTLGIQREQNLRKEFERTKPDATSILGEYKVTKNVSISGQQKFVEKGGRLSTIGVNTTPIEGTNVTGKYEIGNAIGEHRNMISIGVKNQLKLPYDITANFAYEKTKSLEKRIGETPTQDHSAISAAFEYLPPDRPIKLVTKGEFGENQQVKKYNFFFGGDYCFMKNLSLILKYKYWNEDDIKSDRYQTRSHLISGLAYRPVASNWLNAIGKFEMKEDKNHYLSPSIDYNAYIASIHTYIEPLKRFEIGTKYAFKVSQEKSHSFSAKTTTHFGLMKVTYDITRSLDIGAEYRMLLQKEVNDLLNGYSAEVGYIIAKNLRFAAGYNFKGYKERDLVDYSLWSKGPFIGMSFKFDESILR